jgi:hypothetical protein
MTRAHVCRGHDCAWLCVEFRESDAFDRDRPQWKKRWLEVRGDELSCCFDNATGGEVKGTWSLSEYELALFPGQQAAVARRERVIALIPKPEESSGKARLLRKPSQRAVTEGEAPLPSAPVIFSAEDDEEFNKWSRVLKSKMAMADEGAASESMCSSFGTPRSMVDSGGGTAEVNAGDFDVMNVIGKGGFGKVLLVQRKPERTLLAMKVMDKAFILQQEQQSHINSELAVMKQVQHPFIVRLECAFQNPTSLFLVLEFMVGGDLYVTMQRMPQKRFTEAQARFVAAELVLALTHLHSLDIVFRDLKPENVLFDRVGHIRLADFGLAKQDASASLRDTTCGTPLYLSPEAIRGMSDGA